MLCCKRDCRNLWEEQREIGREHVQQNDIKENIVRYDFLYLRKNFNKRT